MPDAEDLGSASVASGADDVITDVEGTSAAPSHPNVGVYKPF